MVFQKNLNWPLVSDPFTYWDRIKAAGFLLNKKNQLTMGPKVAEFERKMGEFAGYKCLATSSGSAANQLIFETYKQLYPDKFKESLVICPAVTWISSVSPAIMAGYKVEFCDVNLEDFSFKYDKLEEILYKNKEKHLIIYPTALIGFCPDFAKLRELARQYKAEVWGDFCENTFSNYGGKSILGSCRFSSTSCYFSHQIVSVEFGFAFFQWESEYEAAKMIRNHGLVRSLPESNLTRVQTEMQNRDIDPQFLFARMGTNLRPTDIHAIWGLMDFERRAKYKEHRKNIYSIFKCGINTRKYYLPETNPKQEHVAFCLPIFRKDDKINQIKSHLNSIGVQTRPIISGNLLKQPVFRNLFGKYFEGSFKSADWIHSHGCYVGLHNNLKEKDVNKLVEVLNAI